MSVLCQLLVAALCLCAIAVPAANGFEHGVAASVTGDEEAALNQPGAVAQKLFKQGQKAFLQQDYAGALSLWSPLAEDGVLDAQFGLGLMYESGWGVAADLELAAYWYQAAAAQGLAKAQFSFGLMLLDGRGVQQNEGMGWYWIQNAADNNEPRASQYLQNDRKQRN